MRVLAVSHSAQFDVRQTVFDKLAAAMDEAAEQAISVALPLPKPAPAQLAMAHRELAGGTSARSVCTVLLAERQQILGAITLERTERPFTVAEISFCEDAAAMSAPLLAHKTRAQLSWPALTALAAKDAWRNLVATDRTAARLAIASAAALIALALLIPIPYHLSAPARLEGFVQRAVVAPVDGYLEQVNVRAGDAVKEGQVLAQLATQDLETERARRQSELVQQENLYKAALARADRTQLVINQAKAAEAQAQLALVEHRLQRSQLRAPFDGVVIKGDLSQQLGAPVQRGEVLLTVAPDRRYRLIVELDERDVALAERGLRGSVVFAASPRDQFDFSVARVIPVAVAGEGRNFFELEASLDGESGLLRPGLRGVAKLSVGKRTGAWILTHRLIDWLRLTAWSHGA
jgi:RND family efflux transporter MFP subunit